MEAYLALIHPPEGGSSYGVTFPDVPGCVSAGDTFGEAIANAEEALSSHLALLRADGDPVPEPRRYEELIQDAEMAQDAQGAAWAAIVPRVVPTPRVRVNIMIDPLLLRELDEAAAREGINRSAYIEAAVRNCIRGHTELQNQVRDQKVAADHVSGQQFSTRAPSSGLYSLRTEYGVSYMAVVGGDKLPMPERGSSEPMRPVSSRKRDHSRATKGGR